MSGEQSGGRWICLSCRKIVTAKPIGRCEDCGGHSRLATDEDAACDRCGDEDGRRLLDRTWGVDRLCDGCITDLGLRDGESISDEDLVTDGGREQSGDRVCRFLGCEVPQEFPDATSEFCIHHSLSIWHYWRHLADFGPINPAWRSADEDAITLSDRQRERIERIKEQCKLADPDLPEPSDEQVLDSLLDTWDAVGNGHYCDHTPEIRTDGGDLCEYCEQREATMWSDQGKRQCDYCAPPGVATDGGRDEDADKVRHVSLDHLSPEALEDLHECILGTETIATCNRNDCQNDAEVVASAPCSSTCFAICPECLPDHVEWYELEPAEREARRIADEVAASLNPEVDYVR